MLNLKVKKLEPRAIVPSYSHPGDAGMDLYSLEKVTLKPGDHVAMRTGIALQIPEGYVGLVWDKSGLSIRNGIKTLGGVIDAGYRGEVQIGIMNLGQSEYTFEAGHKIAQMLIQKIEQVTIEDVAEISSTQRGINGFGSTGK